MLAHSLVPTRWHTASDRGSRSVNADAAAAFTDPGTGARGFALADGVGDNAAAARAAWLAVSAAVHAAPAGPVPAVLAAQQAVRADPAAGDSVLVVAVPFTGPGGHGYRVAWVGDARAYTWDTTGQASGPRQLTTDHTLAEYFRRRGQVPSARMEHQVTTSVRTAAEREIGTAAAYGAGGLLLSSDGVHKRLTAATIGEILEQGGDTATMLVSTAIALGGSDNATALVVGTAPRLDATTAGIRIPRV